jgi:hypothetical protein
VRAFSGCGQLFILKFLYILLSLYVIRCHHYVGVQSPDHGASILQLLHVNLACMVCVAETARPRLIAGFQQQIRRMVLVRTVAANHLRPVKKLLLIN